LTVKEAGQIVPHNQAFSYEEWVKKWWQWALGIPWEKSPLIDETGDHGIEGQQGEVWFLAGTLYPTSDSAQRSIQIPASVKAFFFPVVAFELSDLEVSDAESNELVPIARNAIDGVVHKEVFLDGRPIQSFRVSSPQIFSFQAPANSIVKDQYGLIAQNKKGEGVADGFYVYLTKPIPGRHVIQFSGKFLYDEYTYSTSVRYHLTLQTTS
jgi:hypothetical protein